MTTMNPHRRARDQAPPARHIRKHDRRPLPMSPTLWREFRLRHGGTRTTTYDDITADADASRWAAAFGDEREPAVCSAG